MVTGENTDAAVAAELVKEEPGTPGQPGDLVRRLRLRRRGTACRDRRRRAGLHNSAVAAELRLRVSPTLAVGTGDHAARSYSLVGPPRSFRHIPAVVYSVISATVLSSLHGCHHGARRQKTRTFRTSGRARAPSGGGSLMWHQPPAPRRSSIGLPGQSGKSALWSELGLVSEQPRYYLQHALGFQIHDAAHPHHPRQHGRADMTNGD